MKNEQKIWKRNCPECNGELICKRKNYFIYSTKKNSLCHECAMKKLKKGENRIYKKNCPSCKKEILFGSYGGYWSSKKYNKKCRSCIKLGNVAWNKGLDISNEIVKKMGEKISKRLKGRKFNVKWLNKIAISQRKRLSEELRGKNRCPRYNLKACKIFDEINNELKWSGIYGTNNGELYIKELGYWVDYYEPNLNLIIEYYEKHHNRKKYLLKDIKRQTEIENKLQCQFVIIKEFDDWRNNEQISKYIQNM